MEIKESFLVSLLAFDNFALFFNKPVQGMDQTKKNRCKFNQLQIQLSRIISPQLRLLESLKAISVIDQIYWRSITKVFKVG